jgi:hypothetical protein
MIGDLVGPGNRIATRAADVVASSDIEIVIEGPCGELVPAASELFRSG